MNSILVIIDVQQKIMDVMHESNRSMKHIVQLIKGAKIVEWPIFLFEQYPKGLGPTAEEIQQVIPSIQPIAKTTFSAFENEAFQQTLATFDEKPNVILCGIETHICVYQTAIQLLEAGYDVWCIADATSARTSESKAIGLRLIEQAGGKIANNELVLFDALKDAKHPKFKQISELIK